MSRLHQLQFTVAHALGFSHSTSRPLATDLDARLILQISHISLLFTEAVSSTHADNSSITHCQLVVNSLLRTLTCTLMNTTGTLLLYYYYWYCLYFTTINAGIRHAEDAALCTVARDVPEVTWSFLTVAPSSITA
jgi:hypothetical protein